MLISHRQHFIYTKTVKTAGTSVEAYFERWCLPASEQEFTHHREQHVGADGVVGQRGPGASRARWYNHMPAALIRERVGQQTWNAYFKFCVIRDPFDKLVSWYHFQAHKGLAAPVPDGDPVAGFRAHLASGVPVLDRGQYTIDDRFCLDEVIRFETLESGIALVCARLGLPFELGRLPRLKQGLRDPELPIAAYYTPELAQQVAKAYAFEMKRFGYGLPAGVN